MGKTSTFSNAEVKAIEKMQKKLDARALKIIEDALDHPCIRELSIPLHAYVSHGKCRMGFLTTQEWQEWIDKKYSISFDAKYLTMSINQIKNAEAKRLAKVNRQFERTRKERLEERV